ncbi:MAG TPA: hypothetical protein VHB79_24205 [Polyangiaceae bacterium]|nr:hypothetical protein [Polyangiaceae bacterium]
MVSAPLWLESHGGPEISGIASDSAGRVWVTQSGKQMLLLASSGELVWKRPFGERIALTATGEAYVAGTFEGSVSFGAAQLTSQGSRDVYVLKISNEGEVLGAFAVGGPEDDSLESLNVDAHGDVFVSGAGLGTRKLSPNGDVLWQKPYSGRLALDTHGDVLLTGELTADTDFGGGVLRSRGGADVLLVKLSATGEHLLSVSFGDEGEQQRGQQIAVDSAGNVLLAGTFDGSLDFGAGRLSLPSDACSADAWCLTFGFITKLSGDGRALWSTSLGPLREVGGLVVDGSGGAIVSAASPGGVRPFRLTWLGAFDGDGRERWHRAEWPDTGIGAGRALAVQGCERLIWGISARPSLEAEEQSYIAAWGP